MKDIAGQKTKQIIDEMYFLINNFKLFFLWNKLSKPNKKEN